MANTQSPPFPALTTARLALRQLAAADLPALAALRSDPSVNRYLQRPGQASLAEAAAFIEKINRGIAEREWLYWAISRLGSPELIGTICLWNFSGDGAVAEIGYELSPPHQGQGLMDEALKRVIRYSFEVAGLERLEAFTHRDNAASSRLLTRNQFRLDPERQEAGDGAESVFVLSRG